MLSGGVFESVAVFVTMSETNSLMVRLIWVGSTGALFGGAQHRQARFWSAIESMRHPEFPPLSSVPQRQRNRTLCPLADAGKTATDVTYPADEPLQQPRPANGLLVLVTMASV